MTREVLLIDDDLDELEVFSEALHSIDKNIKCTQAKNLEEALQFLSDTSPEFIFIDFNMPKSNGFDCLAELKKINRLSDSKVILYSNHINDEISEKAAELGAFRCIKKPNMISVLAQKLKEIVR
jgi:CheY-like chemotaxis protein